MKKINSFLFSAVLILAAFALTACGGDTSDIPLPEIKLGKYYLVGGASVYKNQSDGAYVEIKENNKIYFHDFDFFSVDADLAESLGAEVNTARDISDTIEYVTKTGLYVPLGNLDVTGQLPLYLHLKYDDYAETITCGGYVFQLEQNA